MQRTFVCSMRSAIDSNTASGLAAELGGSVGLRSGQELEAGEACQRHPFAPAVLQLPAQGQCRVEAGPGLLQEPVLQVQVGQVAHHDALRDPVAELPGYDQRTLIEGSRVFQPPLCVAQVAQTDQ